MEVGDWDDKGEDGRLTGVKGTVKKQFGKKWKAHLCSDGLTDLYGGKQLPSEQTQDPLYKKQGPIPGTVSLADKPGMGR